MKFFPAASAMRARKFLVAAAIALVCNGAAIASTKADEEPETAASEDKPYVSRLTPAQRRALGAEFYRRLSPYFLGRAIRPAVDTSDSSQPGLFSAAQQVSGIPDGQILLMDIQLDQFYLPEPLPVEKRGAGFLIRLEDLVRALDFPIEVDEAAGRADGWFIRESNLFRLDLESGSLLVGERNIRVGPHTVQRRGDQIWISNVVAADWFSIEFVIAYRQLLVILKPAEMLPIQQRLRRANMRVASRPRHVMPTRNPYVAAPRPLIAAPSFDTQLINSLNANKGKNFRGTSSYAVKAKAPLLGGALDGFFSGDQSDALRAARFSLGYKEPDGVFGLPVVTQVSFGDVYSVRTSLLGSGRLERGVYMSNLPLGRQINLDTTTIAGDSFPGYDVQLFRDAALIGSQEIGDDGRYEFDEVPVFAGINEFLLVFHSPQGQVIEETQIVNVDPARFSGSRLVYELSLTEQNRRLLNDTASIVPVDGGLRAAGRTQFALGGGFALEAGFESLEDVGQRRSLGYAGLSQSSRSLRTRAVITADLDGNLGVEALVQARLGKARVRLEHRELGDIGLLGAGGKATRRFSRANLTGSMRLGGTRSPMITYNFSGKREEFVNGELIQDLGAGLGTRIIGFSLSSNVSYRKKGSVNNTTTSEESFVGTSQVSAVRGRWQTRIRSTYEFAPRMKVTSLGADIGYRITDKIRPQARIQHETLTNLTSATAFLNYDAGFARISPSLSYDTRDRFAAFVTVHFSTTREPETGKWHFLDRPITEDGHLSALVFLDENENGRLDAGEQLLDNVEVAAIHQRMSTATNAKGIAFFPRLRSFERTDIEIIRETLADPAQAPAQAGWSIMPRPGVTQKLNLPVVRIWSIRGSLVESQGQSARGFSGLPVRLRDLESGEVVAETRSDSEGGFEIRDVRNGQYRIELDNALLEEEGFVPAKARYVSTTKLTAEYTGIDMVSAPLGMVASYPSMTGAAARSVPLGTKIADVSDAAVPPYHALLLGYSRSRLGIALKWTNIRRRAPQLFVGLRPIVNSLDSARIAAMPTQRYPLRVGPIPKRDDAELLCDLLRHNRIPCRVVPGFELPADVTY